jgi:exosortase/archaeosortase family protein
VEIPQVTVASMKASHPEAEQGKPELGMLFVLLVALSVTATSYLPKAFFEFWRQLVMAIAGKVGALAGITVTRSADVLTVNGFAMQVIDECTALNYVIILGTAILLYRRHSIGYRLAGVALAIPAIVVVNAFRLVVTGIAGSISRKWFDYVHEYLWVALFALLIFAMWKLWADRSFKISRAAFRSAAVAVVGCSPTFALLIALMPLYGPLMASLSSLMVKVFLGDTHAAIFFVGSKLHCTYGSATYRIPFNLEFFNIAVLAGLLLPLQKKGELKTLALSLLCLAAALVVNGIVIANSFYIMARHGEAAFNAFLLVEKGMLLAVPFALYWIVASGREDRVAAVP